MNNCNSSNNEHRVFITNLQVMVDSCIYSNKVCKFYLCVLFFWSVNAQCEPFL